MQKTVTVSYDEFQILVNLKENFDALVEEKTQQFTDTHKEELEYYQRRATIWEQAVDEIRTKAAQLNFENERLQEIIDKQEKQLAASLIQDNPPISRLQKVKRFAVIVLSTAGLYFLLKSFVGIFF